MHVYFKDSMFAASSSFMSMTQGCNMCITQVTEHALATYHAIMAIMQPCNIQEFSSSFQNFQAKLPSLPIPIGSLFKSL